MDRTNEVGTIARAILAQRLLWCRERGAELRQETVDALAKDAVDSAREANVLVDRLLKDDDAQRCTRKDRIVRLALEANALGLVDTSDPWSLRLYVTTMKSESSAVRKALAAKDGAS